MRDELGLVALVEGGVEPDRLTARAARPQVLAEARGVVGNQTVGGREDIGGGAVVLLEAEQLCLAVVAAELLQVLGTCASEPVKRLVVIAHDERMTRARAFCIARGPDRRSEQSHPCV